MQLCPSLMLGLNWGQIGTVTMAVVFLVACLLLILIVLIQKPQGGGLAGAFGSGAGSGQTAFGTRTGDALTVATIAFFVIYLASAVGMSYITSPIKPEIIPPAASSADKPAPGTTPPGTTPADATTPPMTNSVPVLPATDPATPPKDPAAVPGTAPAVPPGSTPAAPPPPGAAPGTVLPEAPRPETPKN